MWGVGDSRVCWCWWTTFHCIALKKFVKFFFFRSCSIVVHLHGHLTNQHIDLFQNQIMRFSIFQSDIVPFEILAMHTRCKKGFITYYKSNDITPMKKMLIFTALP